MKKSSLPANRFKKSTTETVEMTEIDGLERGAILTYTDVRRSSKSCEDREIKTCIGDLYVIVNALRDYANILEGVIPEWGLLGFHAAIYNLHAARCRKIAGKYAKAIGYNYDRALERCRRSRAKGVREGDIGMDGLEAIIRKQELDSQKQKEHSEEIEDDG